MICESSRLKVEVAELGARYRGTRFDWTALIVEVELDGRHRFCTSESQQQGAGSGGLGLCNEFGLERPLGYDEAAPGEQFPKLGIGLLTRLDGAACDHMRSYPLEPFAMACERTAQGARWTVEPRACRGYAVRLRKELEVAGARISLSYRLDNLGQRAIRTSEYNHNFIAIDGHAIGPDYHLATSAPIAALPGAFGVAINERGFSWGGEVSAARPFSARCLSAPGASGGFAWTLSHLPSGVAVSESIDRQPALIGLWGMAHVVSPELFVDIDVAPGTSMEWRRDYRFSAP
jgi:hypothetical protein